MYSNIPIRSRYRDVEPDGLGKPGRMKMKTKVIVRKWFSEESKLRGDDPFEVKVNESNVGLNEGIQLAWDLMIAAGGTAWDNGNAWLGVGCNTDAAAAAQTALQAATDATASWYLAMDATAYPGRTDQTVSWRSTYGATSANFAWTEFTVANASSNTGVNLVRKVSMEGTKTSGQSWELTLAVTMS